MADNSSAPTMRRHPLLSLVTNTSSSINKRSSLPLLARFPTRCWQSTVWDHFHYNWCQVKESRSFHTFYIATLHTQDSLSVSLTHSQAHKWNLAEPFLFCKTDTESNLWNWQGPIALCHVSSDHFSVSQVRKREKKTVRISAIPTVIFITTTWEERKRERFTKYCERVLPLQEVGQTNTFEIRFQSFRIQGHAESGENEENKQRESKTKIIWGYRSRNQNEKAHSQT